MSFFIKFFLNAVTTTTTKRFIFRVIQKYFYRTYNVDYFLIIFKISDMTFKNNNKSLYNEINIEIVVNLTENIIQKDIFILNQIIIFTFYRAQLKLYQQTFRNIILSVSKIDKIDVKTINSMQNNESIFIIRNIVIFEFLNFIRWKNHVNVVCFRFKNDLTIIANVHDIMKLHKNKRFYFEKIFSYVKNFYVEHTSVEQFFCKFSLFTFKRKYQHYKKISMSKKIISLKLICKSKTINQRKIIC